MEIVAVSMLVALMLLWASPPCTARPQNADFWQALPNLPNLPANLSSSSASTYTERLIATLHNRQKLGTKDVRTQSNKAVREKDYPNELSLVSDFLEQSIPDLHANPDPDGTSIPISLSNSPHLTTTLLGSSNIAHESTDRNPAHNDDIESLDELILLHTSEDKPGYHNQHHVSTNLRPGSQSAQHVSTNKKPVFQHSSSGTVGYIKQPVNVPHINWAHVDNDSQKPTAVTKPPYYPQKPSYGDFEHHRPPKPRPTHYYKPDYGYKPVAVTEFTALTHRPLAEYTTRRPITPEYTTRRPMAVEYTTTKPIKEPFPHQIVIINHLYPHKPSPSDELTSTKPPHTTSMHSYTTQHTHHTTTMPPYTTQHTYHTTTMPSYTTHNDHYATQRPPYTTMVDNHPTRPTGNPELNHHYTTSKPTSDHHQHVPSKPTFVPYSTDKPAINHHTSTKPTFVPYTTVKPVYTTQAEQFQGHVSTEPSQPGHYTTHKPHHDHYTTTKPQHEPYPTVEAWKCPDIIINSNIQNYNNISKDIPGCPNVNVVINNNSPADISNEPPRPGVQGDPPLAQEVDEEEEVGEEEDVDGPVGPSSTPATGIFNFLMGLNPLSYGLWSVLLAPFGLFMGMVALFTPWALAWKRSYTPRVNNYYHHHKGKGKGWHDENKLERYKHRVKEGSRWDKYYPRRGEFSGEPRAGEEDLRDLLEEFVARALSKMEDMIDEDDVRH